jgi:membrane-associated phospholipid phosphatase
VGWLLAAARMYLGVDAPSDVLVGAAIGVPIPLLAADPIGVGTYLWWRRRAWTAPSPVSAEAS